MRIGLYLTVPGTHKTLSAFVEAAVEAERQGFASLWTAQTRSFDAMMALALVGARTSRIELGTAVVPTFPRHPLVMAQQAITAQAASGSRFVLGIGLSHRSSMEPLGYSWDKPILHMREYLTALNTLLKQEPLHLEGETVKAGGARVELADAAPPPVIVAALGPQMLKLTGQLADGTVIWMGGPRYIEEAVVPVLSTAAAEAGRAAPRIIASVPVCVTGEAATVKERLATGFAGYGNLPSYRAILDKSGDQVGPADVSLIGTASEVGAGLRSFASAGATEFAAYPYTPRGVDPEPTYQLLKEWRG
jgi:F420-dependent oxidoreductase-like protein